jgi:UDP-N-acetylmuramoyl-tripeptide--D-alanyl-D-alanine ligase
MLELGARTESLHKQVGAWVAVANIDKMMVTGEFANAVISGAVDAKMNRDDIFSGSHDEILDALKNSLRPGDWVLIKGSRGARMDTIVEGLKEWAKIKPEA